MAYVGVFTIAPLTQNSHSEMKAFLHTISIYLYDDNPYILKDFNLMMMPNQHQVKNVC